MFKRNEYKILNQMLDDAISGDFKESKFDESELSKIQTKLLRYLNSTTLTAEKLGKEKAQIEELVTNISHQVKTPLTNIMMYSELLSESATEDQREYVDQINHQSQKLNGLLQALVKMSRLETGIFRFEQVDTSLKELAEASVEELLPKAGIKEILLHKGWDDTTADIRVCIDKKWTMEAVTNILDNAIKYSPKNSTIDMELFQYEIFSGIRIRDYGIGISEEETPLVFSRFYRSKTVRDEEGIGVGLFLARQVVEEQGGYIKLHSKLGEGSCFELYFPNHMRM